MKILCKIFSNIWHNIKWKKKKNYKKIKTFFFINFQKIQKIHRDGRECSLLNFEQTFCLNL